MHFWGIFVGFLRYSCPPLWSTFGSLAWHLVLHFTQCSVHCTAVQCTFHSTASFQCALHFVEPPYKTHFKLLATWLTACTVALLDGHWTVTKQLRTIWSPWNEIGGFQDHSCSGFWNCIGHIWFTFRFLCYIHTITHYWPWNEIGGFQDHSWSSFRRSIGHISLNYNY